MKPETKPPDQEQMIEEIKARQRNTLWPETFTNGRAVSTFLWRGSPDATLVQRVGLWIFGILFILFGILAIEGYRDAGPDERSYLSVVAAIILFSLGARVFLNGFRRHGDK
jgi:hypothetical protein